MFHLNGFRLFPGLQNADGPMPGLCSAGRMGGRGWGGGGVQQAKLKAASCQPVSYWGLITQTPMKKLLEGN